MCGFRRRQRPTASVMQARAGSPSINMVQAPQTPCSQPRCVAVSRNSSRKKSARLVRGSTADCNRLAVDGDGDGCLHGFSAFWTARTAAVAVQQNLLTARIRGRCREFVADYGCKPTRRDRPQRLRATIEPAPAVHHPWRRPPAAPCHAPCRSERSPSIRRIRRSCARLCNDPSVRCPAGAALRWPRSIRRRSKAVMYGPVRNPCHGIARRPLGPASAIRPPAR